MNIAYLKKYTLLASWVIAVLLLAVDRIGTSAFCPQYSDCITNFANVLRSLIPFLALAPLSLLFYFIRDQVFKVWFGLTVIAIPLIVVLAYLTPEAGNLIPSGPGVTALLLGVLYTIISLLIALIGFFSSFRKSKGTA